MDSQWWVHPYDKPGIESDCPYKTKSEVLTQLDDLLSRNSKKLVIFALHHTLRSYGIHGGYFKLKQHIFPLTEYFPKLYIPLPVIGSIYPISRSVFGSPQDLKHPFYTEMITSVERFAFTISTTWPFVNGFSGICTWASAAGKARYRVKTRARDVLRTDLWVMGVEESFLI